MTGMQSTTVPSAFTVSLLEVACEIVLSTTTANGNAFLRSFHFRGFLLLRVPLFILVILFQRSSPLRITVVASYSSEIQPRMKNKYCQSCTIISTPLDGDTSYSWDCSDQLEGSCVGKDESGCISNVATSATTPEPDSPPLTMMPRAPVSPSPTTLPPVPTPVDPQTWPPSPKPVQAADASSPTPTRPPSPKPVQAADASSPTSTSPPSPKPVQAVDPPSPKPTQPPSPKPAPNPTAIPTSAPLEPIVTATPVDTKPPTDEPESLNSDAVTVPTSASTMTPPLEPAETQTGSTSMAPTKNLSVSMHLMLGVTFSVWIWLGTPQ